MMNRNAVYFSYVQSLLWITLFVALIPGVTIIVELVFVDFIHGNTHRSQANALLMMFLYPPILGAVAILGAFVVFTVPQCFQAIVAAVLVPRFGRLAIVGVALLIPLTAVITWYCWDFWTPSDVNLGINEGPDWVPYQHGLTPERYLTIFAIQAPVTMFSGLYCDTAIRHRSKKPLILTALAASIFFGAIWGYSMAENQFKFL